MHEASPKTLFPLNLSIEFDSVPTPRGKRYIEIHYVVIGRSHSFLDEPEKNIKDPGLYHEEMGRID